jgi:hypothetical protein
MGRAELHRPSSNASLLYRMLECWLRCYSGPVYMELLDELSHMLRSLVLGGRAVRAHFASAFLIHFSLLWVAVLLLALEQPSINRLSTQGPGESAFGGAVVASS